MSESHTISSCLYKSILHFSKDLIVEKTSELSEHWKTCLQKKGFLLFSRPVLRDWH